MNGPSFVAMTILGQTGRLLRFGHVPGPWMLFDVDFRVYVYDKNKKRTPVACTQKCVIRGQANIEAYRSLLGVGVGVLVSGPMVPAFVVAKDKFKGHVLMVNEIQISRPAGS